MVNDRTRDRWLHRLWGAPRNDEIRFIERLADFWGELCASQTRASAWAERLMGTVVSMWGSNRKPGGYFLGTIACLSALFHAGRHEELLALPDKAPPLDVALPRVERQGTGGLGAEGTGYPLR